MDYEWDELKNAGNKRKHGVGFELVDHLTGKKQCSSPTAVLTMAKPG